MPKRSGAAAAASASSELDRGELTVTVHKNGTLLGVVDAEGLPGLAAGARTSPLLCSGVRMAYGERQEKAGFSSRREGSRGSDTGSYCSRENETASAKAFTEFFHNQTKAWQRIYKRGVEVKEGARVASEAAARGLELAESRDEAWAYRLERKLAKKRRKVWGGRKGGWGVREGTEMSAAPSQHEQEQEQRQPMRVSLIARLLLSLLAAAEAGVWGGRGGDGGKKREKNRSRSRSESRENSGDAAIETKRRRQAREGRHCEIPPGSRHQVAHWGNVAGRRKGDPRDRGPGA